MKNNPHRTPISLLVFVLFASASGVLAEQDDPLARSAAEFLSELDLAMDRTNSVLNWNSGPQTAITNDYGTDSWMTIDRFATRCPLVAIASQDKRPGMLCSIGKMP